jgi:hypothetical protein
LNVNLLGIGPLMDASHRHSTDPTAGLASPATNPIGLRERNKSEKLQRIRNAARALFMKGGYDDTTMRDIARRAEVGFGTRPAFPHLQRRSPARRRRRLHTSGR